MANILLVEDNKISQKMMFYTLKRLGLDVDYAEDGAETVAKAIAKEYDVILMDIMMPVFDGYEATRRIRSHEAETGSSKRAFIIGLTGNVYDMEEQKCIDAGMDAYMPKPFDVPLFQKIMGDRLAV